MPGAASQRTHSPTDNPTRILETSSIALMISTRCWWVLTTASLPVDGLPVPGPAPDHKPVSYPYIQEMQW